MAVRFSASHERRGNTQNQNYDRFAEDNPRNKAARPTHEVVDEPFHRKIPITIRLHPNTVAKFRATGKGWQSRISAILDAV